MKLHEMSEKQIWTLILCIGFVLAIMFYLLGTTIHVQPVISYVNKTYSVECLQKCMIQ